MDIEFQIAIMAGVAVIVSAIISSFVSLYISRKTFGKESEKNAIRYLERKIEYLEKQKHELREFMKGTPSSQEPASAIAELTSGRFNLTFDILEKISHYLNDNARQELFEHGKRIRQAFAIEMAIKKGMVVKEVKEKESFLSGPQIIDQMNKFADDVTLGLEKELSISTSTIERISGLR
jgi:hypothetical protein